MNPSKNNHAVRLVSLVVLLVVAIVVSFLITDVFRKKTSDTTEPAPNFKPTISRTNLDIFNDLKAINPAPILTDKERVDIFKAMKSKNKSDTQLTDKQKAAILSAMIQAQK